MDDPALSDLEEQGEDVDSGDQEEEEMDYEEFSKLSKEEQLEAILESGAPTQKKLFELYSGKPAKTARKEKKKKTEQDELDDLVREIDPSLVGKVKLASGRAEVGSLAEELGLDEEDVKGLRVDPSITYAGDTRSDLAKDLGLTDAEIKGLKAEPAVEKFDTLDDLYDYVYQAAPGSAIAKPPQTPNPQSVRRTAPKGQPSSGDGDPSAHEGEEEESNIEETESMGLDSQALEDEIIAMMQDPSLANMSDEAVGNRLVDRFSARFKEKSKEAIKSAIYTWWQNNWRKIARDAAISVGAAVLFNYVIPWCGGPAFGLNLFKLAKEMGMGASLWPLAGTLVSGIGGAFRGALFTTAREAVRGKNVLGAAFVQKTFEYLHLGKPHLDAAVLLDMAEIPISVAMRPGTFKRIFMEPFGLWQPLTNHKKTLANEFFWGTMSAAAFKAAGKLKQNYGVTGMIGRALKTAAFLPQTIITRLYNSELLRTAGSKAKAVFEAGVAKGADYITSKTFQEELAGALTEDQLDPRLQELAKQALNDAIEGAVNEADEKLEEAFEKDPVEEEYIRAALSTPLPPPPTPILEVQAESLTMAGRASTLIALGTTAAGWIATGMLLNAVGAPSISELASVLPDEYTGTLSSVTKSISENIDVNRLAYTAISSSIGLGGLVKKLAGKVPLPQIEALQKFNAKISTMSQSMVNENSSAIAKEFMGIMLGTRIYTKTELEKLSIQELKTMWVEKGGKDASSNVSKASLVNALIKAQKDAASALHVGLVEGLAAQAANSAGSAALAGSARIVYSNAQGIYSAISENGIVAAAAGIDELAQKTLSTILGDSSMDPYGIFSASARYSKDVAAVISESGNSALLRAYEAKRKLDDYIGSLTQALVSPSTATPAVASTGTTTALPSFPDVASLNSAEGVENMKQFMTRMASMAAIRAGLPAPGEEEMIKFTKETIQLMKEADMTSEANFHAKGGLSRSNVNSPFETPVMDDKAFNAAKTLAQEKMKRTSATVGAALDQMRGTVDPVLLERMFSAAMLGTLFKTTTEVSTAPQVKVKIQEVSEPKQAPLKVNKAAFDDAKGVFLDPLVDVLTMRGIEFGLDSGMTALAYLINPAAAAASGGIGLYNQAAKWTNRGLDLATVVRAVAMSLDATKDGTLAKMPKPTSFRLPEAGSFKEVLKKIPFFTQLEEERKIDAGAVVLEEVSKYAAALLPGQERMTKFQLFSNIALGLAGPLTPGIGEVAARSYYATVDAIRDRLIEEDALNAPQMI